MLKVRPGHSQHTPTQFETFGFRNFSQKSDFAGWSLRTSTNNFIFSLVTEFIRIVSTNVIGAQGKKFFDMKRSQPCPRPAYGLKRFFPKQCRHTGFSR